MGQCSSEPVHPENAEAIAANKTIDKYLRSEEKRLQRELKLLLLGASDSGKTTILKQMKVIHLNGFGTDELEGYRKQIFLNLFDAIFIGLAVLKEWEFSLSPINQPLEPMFQDAPVLKDGEPFPVEYKEAMQQIWEDDAFQKVVQRANEAAMPENAAYFFDQIDEVFDPTYRPSDQDVFRCRWTTTGINETIFQQRELTYRVFDVGGQRNQRSKWIHCFENVTAILFVASLSGYDQCLVEDRNSNQMQESLDLFESIANSHWFTKTSMILFLNKLDVFNAKLPTSSIRRHFPDYEGDESDVLQAREFFKGKFLALNKSTKASDVYVAYTTAVDTTLFSVVMASVSDLILSRNLQEIVF